MIKYLEHKVKVKKKTLTNEELIEPKREIENDDITKICNNKIKEVYDNEILIND